MIAALLILVSGALTVQAQDVPVNGPALEHSQLHDSVEIRARRYLEMNSGKHSALDYRDLATRKLRQDGIEIDDYHRVEFPGIFSGGDDTSDTFPDLFDGRAPSSQVGSPTSETVLPQWAQGLEHPIEDLAGLVDDSGEKISEYAKAAVSKYEKAEIGTVVAHSWGAEVVYNAIFLGKIKPPKRLILAGVTESNWEKWKALSAYTGTEVLIYDNKLDYAAQTGRGLHLADNTAYHFQMSADTSRLEEMWQTACQNITCNEHHRNGVFRRKTYIGAPVHSRFTYYQKMIDDGVIAPDVAVRGSVQTEIVDGEANRMFHEAMDKARQAIRESDERQQKFLEDQRRRAPLPAPLPLGSAPVLESAGDQEARRQFLAERLWIMQGIAKSACTTGLDLTEEQTERFRLAYDSLAWAESNSERAGIDGYDPEAALQSLTGCDRELMSVFLQHRGSFFQASGVNTFARPVLQKYHPAPPPYRAGPHRDPDDKSDPVHCHPATEDSPAHCDEGYTW